MFLKIMLLKHYLNMSDNLEESSLCYLWPNESSISDLPKNKSAAPGFANLPFIPPCPSVLLFILPLVSFICCVQTLSHSTNLFPFPEFSALLSHSLRVLRGRWGETESCGSPPGPLQRSCFCHLYQPNSTPHTHAVIWEEQLDNTFKENAF